MGFDVERKSRSPELWEMGDDSAANALVKEEHESSLIRGEKTSSIREKKTSPVHAGNTARNTESSGASTRKNRSLLIMIMMLVVIVFPVCFQQFSRIIPGFMREKDNMEQSAPISKSMRESLIKDMVPLPSGMEFGRYEMQGTVLTIYVSGKQETAASDYIISASFALRLMEEADNVRFVEEDTGREYSFDR